MASRSNEIKTFIEVKKQQQQPKSQKSPRGSLKQQPSLGVLLNQLLIKKMITEMFMMLPLYLILFFIWCRFRCVMEKVENILNDDDFFGDIADIPKEGIEQHR